MSASSPKIQAFNVRAVRLPMTEPHQTASGVITGSLLVLTDIVTDAGVTGWLRAAALAHAEGIRMSNHLWAEISAQLLCCTPTAHWLEYAQWWNDILAEPLRVENGMAFVDGATGTGIDWNESAVERFAA